MTVYALWHGGSGYSPGYVEEDTEKFETIQDAIIACQERMDYGHRLPQEFSYVSKPADSVLVPCVSEDSSMHVWMTSPIGDPDPYPDYTIQVHPETEEFYAEKA